MNEANDGHQRERSVAGEGRERTRRAVLKRGLAAAGATAVGATAGGAATLTASPGTHRRAAPYIRRGRYALFPSTGRQYSARTVELMERSIVVDMLSPMQISNPTWLGDPAGYSDADHAEFVASGITALHVAVGVGGYREPESDVLGYLGAYSGFAASHSDRFVRIDSVDDFGRAKSAGKVGILLGIQNSNHFTRSLDMIDQVWSLGQRVSQLTYNARNRIGNGSTERVDGGISDWGAAVVERMNRVGMAIDVSHSGDRTTMDAFELSQRPVLITHSNCRALVPGHPRCKTDEAIRAMGRSGGVMGITSVRNFVRDREPTTIEHMVDHYEHVARLVGVEHVGIGSDIDLHGYDAMPVEQLARLKAAYKDSYAFRDKIDIEGVDHPQRCYDLAEALLGRFTDDDVVGILGANFVRVLGEIWAGIPTADDDIAN